MGILALLGFVALVGFVALLNLEAIVGLVGLVLFGHVGTGDTCCSVGSSGSGG